jgi:hypothetical protein
VVVRCLLRLPPAGNSDEDSPIVDKGIYIDRSLRRTEGFVSFDDIRQFSSSSYVFAGLFNRKVGAYPAQELPRTQPSELEAALEWGEEAAEEGALSLDQQLAGLVGGGQKRKLLQLGDVPRGLSYNRYQRSYVQPRNLPARVCASMLK